MLTIDRSELSLEPIWTYNPYLNNSETAILVALTKSVQPKVMIEFGCQAGRTARTLLDQVSSLETYIGVDVPFDHDPVLPCQRSEISFNPGLYAADDPRFYLLVRERGSFGLESLDLEPCDAAFIDGDHSEQVVRHDSLLARRLVRPGGIIIWHDFGNPVVEVTQVLSELSDQGWPIQNVSGTWLAFMRVE